MRLPVDYFKQYGYHEPFVYLHLNRKTGIVFYVGMGSIQRPFDFRARNKSWKKYVKKNGHPIVRIVGWFGTRRAAYNKESALIRRFKREGIQLCNSSEFSGSNFLRHPKYRAA